VAVNPPVQRGSTVILPDAASLYAAPVTYGRQGLATQGALEEALAALEAAEHVALFPSGAAAVTAALRAVLKAGDELLCADGVYGPTRRLCDGLLTRYGVSTRYFPPRASAEEVMALAGSATRLVMMESPASLTFEVQDVRAVAAACRARGVLTAMDNTWGAGLLFKPLDAGVDLSIQSLTKYVGGHADAFMGAVSVREPALARALDDLLHDMGWAVSPDDAYVMLRGLRTLVPRMKAHEAGALQVAQWLGDRAEVARVLHPALAASPDHALWRRDFAGANGLFGLVLRPASKRQVHAFLDALRLFGLGFSWGGFESLAVHGDPQLRRTAAPADLPGPLLRLHVGLEDPRDLIADLEHGLAALQAAR
jgi:cystathionine beta-lyase